MSKNKGRLGLSLAALLLSLAVGNSPAVAQDGGGNQGNNQGNPRIRRVLLLSIDGFHRKDLSRWVSSHPQSALAGLTRHGTTYTNATTTTPSDSFPGLLALVTGGTPKSTGVYYDDSYDRSLYAPGNFTCENNIGGGPGTEVVLDETIDNHTDLLFSDGINPDFLPRKRTAGGQCVPVFPHDFIRVNTIFEVIKAAGLHTAWSDKHPAYDLVNGPSGAGVADLYTPEVNSLVINGGNNVNGVDLAGSLAGCNATNSLVNIGGVSVYTDCVPTIEAYDDVKVQAVINQIDGKASDGSASPDGVPAIFGMNFQAVSVGQKLTVAGYTDAAGTPSPALADAIAHTDASIGRMVAELKKQSLLNDTLIIVSAKHGQSPINRKILQMKAGATQAAPNNDVTDPGDILAASGNPVVSEVDAITFANPKQTNGGGPYSTSGHLQTDDVGIIWLSDSSAANASAADSDLTTNAAAIHATTLPAGTIFKSNITSGPSLAAIFGDPTVPGSLAAVRAPNVFIQPNEGVIYSGSKKKIAEHGGGAPGDIDVAMLVSANFLGQSTVDAAVRTTQVAPTILQALGLNPKALQAVVQEGTQVLPEFLDNTQ
jgi:hypothetical protein